MKKRMDLIGQRYGRLVVLAEARRRGVTRIWKCKCDCGKVTMVRMPNLRSGHTTSCGCYARDNITTHGLGHSPIYQVWYHMLNRCEDSANHNYHRYGGRGIRVCAEWHELENFVADMGKKPSPELTLDRIDNDGNYEPDNCRWATMRQQSRNKSTNRLLTMNGKTMCIRDWEAETGIKYTTIWERLRRGWPTKLALTVPTGSRAK